VTKFFFDEGMLVRAITSRLKNDCGENAISLSTVYDYYWVK
jgi:hypothetical protein